MHIRAGYARKLRQCAGHCTIPIQAGEPVLIASIQRGAAFFTGGAYHLECWLLGVRAWWAVNPYIEKPRGKAGRPRLQLSTEDERVRRGLIVRASKLRTRKMTALNQGYLWRLPELEEKMRTIVNALEGVGGKPSHWL